jgi:hypothetical protein
MFLGLRAATTAAQSDYSCASEITAGLEAQAVAWDLRHEDVDLAADIDLGEQLSANLAARSGGYGSCADGADPYPPDDYPPEGYYGDDDVTTVGEREDGELDTELIAEGSVHNRLLQAGA